MVSVVCKNLFFQHQLSPTIIPVLPVSLSISISGTRGENVTPLHSCCGETVKIDQNAFCFSTFPTFFRSVQLMYAYSDAFLSHGAWQEQHLFNQQLPMTVPQLGASCRIYSQMVPQRDTSLIDMQKNLHSQVEQLRKR